MTVRRRHDITKATNKRREFVFKTLRDYHALHGMAPSLRELAEMVGLSHSTVFEYCAVLLEQGRVKQHKGHFLPVNGAS